MEHGIGNTVVTLIVIDTSEPKNNTGSEPKSKINAGIVRRHKGSAAPDKKPKLTPN